MEQPEDILKNLLSQRAIKADLEERFKKFDLNFNPFPRAGISDLNSPDHLIKKLEPIDKSVTAGIEEYIIDSLFPQNPNSTDKYISAVIRGDYGFGKTQTLLFAKHLLDSISKITNINRRPYVVYIDNPGAKLSELIGEIIQQIGDENFKRYLWNVAFEGILKKKEYKEEILNFKSFSNSLFSNQTDPFTATNVVNYRVFFDTAYKNLNNTSPKVKKEFQDTLKSIIVSIFTEEFENSTISLYFYEFISENIGINKTWELLTSGSAKNLDKKEVYLIRSIVKLIESQGYTDFYILVDEFEAVTAGRLTTDQIDRYVTNLRALIDKERNWCALFAMTGFALSRLKSVSPPLAERISTRIIDLKPLNSETATKLTINYLNLARDSSESIYPFNNEAIDVLCEKSKGILRVYLKSCFILLQRAAEELKDGETISSDFVNKHFIIEEE